VKFIRLISAAALFASMFTLPTFAAPIELKFGHVGGPGSLFEVSAEEFAKRANAKLGDKAKVVVFGSSQLGGDKELLQKLKLGTIDFALPSTVMSRIEAWKASSFKCLKSASWSSSTGCAGLLAP